MRFSEFFFWVLNGVQWVQRGSYGFFEVHWGSVRFNEVR